MAWTLRHIGDIIGDTRPLYGSQVMTTPDMFLVIRLAKGHAAGIAHVDGWCDLPIDNARTTAEHTRVRRDSSAK